MKIVRNGIEIELTDEEVDKIYQEKERYHRHIDIQNKVNEMVSEGDLVLDESVYPNGKLDEDTLDVIMDRYDDSLRWQDVYWDSYWGAIAEAINEGLQDYILTEFPYYTFEYENHTLRLTEDAYITGDNANPRYTALAKDEAGVEYRLYWTPVENWEAFEDEQDRCDWEHPDSIERL